MQIRMGAMSPKLSEQIPGISEHYDKDADAISRLAVRGLLTASETDRARRRLIKNIDKELCESP